MKKITLNTIEDIIIGTAREIRSLESNMRRRGFFFVFADKAKYNPNKIYGITVNYECVEEPECYVVNENYIARLALEGVIR